MTSTLQVLRTLAMASAIALYATAASPQSAGKPTAHDHQDQATAPSQGGLPGMAGMPRDVMARVAKLDDRIRTLTADMNMFVGEMKLETMAALLTALVERQSVMRHEMTQMQSGMMRRMMERGPAAAVSSDEGPRAIGEEPGALCAPTP